MTENPYETPSAELGDAGESGVRMDHLIKGQKYMIYAMGLYFVAVLAAALTPLLGAATLLIAFVLGVVGYFRAMVGVDYHIAVKVAFAILIFVPLVNILVLLALNNRVTVQLKKAGHKVGFFGVNG